MLTFKGVQDAILTRFSEASRPSCKEWINYVLGSIWHLEEWTFKQAAALVTVTTGLQTVSALPADVGITHLLQNSVGADLAYRDWREFNRRHYGETQTGLPYDYTVIGTGAGSQLLVGPASSETSSAYQLLYERERSFYPSTTLTATPTLPAATIAVADTSQAPSAGICLIAGRPVAYTGKTPTTLTGCTGGIGTFAAGELVVFLSPQAGELVDDTDVPALPPETHQVLVMAGQAIGQVGENDYSMYLNDSRVQEGLEAMRRRYLIQQRDELVVWPSHGERRAYGGW